VGVQEEDQALKLSQELDLVQEQDQVQDPDKGLRGDQALEPGLVMALKKVQEVDKVPVQEEDLGLKPDQEQE